MNLNFQSLIQLFRAKDAKRKFVLFMISRERIYVALVATGSFNPPTFMHLRLFGKFEWWSVIKWLFLLVDILSFYVKMLSDFHNFEKKKQVVVLSHCSKRNRKEQAFIAFSPFMPRKKEMCRISNLAMLSIVPGLCL